MSAPAAPSMSEREQIEALLKTHFVDAGFPYVELPLVEKTDHFLDLMSDEVRRRAHAFSGQDGDEYWVRSDFTLSACRRFAKTYAPKGEVKVSYGGFVYRNQSYDRPALQRGTGAEAMHAGIEYFRPAGALEADAAVFVATQKAVLKSGAQGHRVLLGDLAFFPAIVAQLDVSDVARGRLLSRFWRQTRADAFIGGLRNETAKRARTRPLIALLSRGTPDEARGAILELFALADIQAIGQRPLEDIIARLLEQAADAADAADLGLSDAIVDALDGFFGIDGPLDQCVAQLKSFSRAVKIDLAPQIAQLEQRFAQIAAAGGDLSGARFKTDLGKDTGYYTGFCFEIWDKEQSRACPLFAAGGRYDKLIKTLGAPQDCPAVGATVFIDAICERLRSS